VIGANLGGAERARLRYAVSDAERFARVLVDLGGVAPANAIVLRQPALRELADALDLLHARVEEARRTAGAGGGRTEILVYYSGHADEQGLLLGADRYAYRTLRDRLDRIPADVRIAVLDACASGAFTRIKSGRARPAFLVDESADMRGHAFLTSSAETEAAQESDRIRASYFTHYLISGFRGAADLSGDGKVTLNEAYQFAFAETVGRTVDTKAGPQHPSYDINLSGTGEVVMTDVRQTSATLVLGEELDGRFFVRNAQKELIVELYKRGGRRVELGLEPGTYEVRLEIAKSSRLATASVGDGARVELTARQFGPVALESARRRGESEVDPLSVAGRNRLQIHWGIWRTPRPPAGALFEGNIVDLFGGVEYARYLREDLALSFGIEGVGSESGASIGGGSIFAGSASAIALPVTVRWNPIGRRVDTRAAKPFVAVGLGPVIGMSEGSYVGSGDLFTGTRTDVTAAAHLGGGVDLHVARSVSIGVSAGYTWTGDFEKPVGSRSDLSGPQFGMSLGWLFGR
jgi:caspase domain-containing protein